MSSNLVHPELVTIALERVDGNTFERFGQAFFSAMSGSDFVPLGGMGDGGADGFFATDLFEERGTPTHFFQASTQEETADKIRQTMKRLREVGRDPRIVTYLSSRRVPRIDQVERTLSLELDVTVRIRDRLYVEGHVNDSVQTRAAFTEFMGPVTAFLHRIGGASSPTLSRQVKSPAVYLFLRQELERRQGDTSLTDATVDALVVWALEGTDPDEGLFMTRDEVVERIIASVPAVKRLVEERVEPRMTTLAGKNYVGGRAIRWYQGDDHYCLPYDTRRVVAEENARDEALRIAVLDGFEDRIRDALGELLGVGTPRKAALVAMRTIELLFEQEGLDFSRFIGGEAEADQLHVTDRLGQALDQIGIPAANRDPVAEAVLEAIRQALLYSTDPEREFFSKLSRTYTLLFTLQAHPEVVDYFQELAGDFYLYVGSDVLIRALSERYLERKDQRYRTALEMAAAAGATLVLAEPVLEEVVGHLRASDYEYRNYFAGIEESIGVDLILHAPKILIRAYFYAREELDASDRPRSWQEYVHQFCDYADLHRNSALAHVRRYLQAQFSLEFETREELMKLVDAEQVRELAQNLKQEKSKQELADNDALMALSVYGRRSALRESARVSELGYRTWWLAGETRILRYTREIVGAHRGERYMMRPDFLLTFIALAPTAAQVRRTYANVFPSTLGIQLGRRLPEEAFHRLMEQVRDAEQLEEGSRQAKVAQLADQLKSDFRRQYGISMEGEV